LPWENNIRGESCVIADTYKCKLWFSEKFNRMVVRLEDKHGRKDCLIHNGNFAGDDDAGMRTDVHGCTEVGRGYGIIPRPDGKGKQFAILNSVKTLGQLVAELGEGEHTIEYRWAEGCEPEDLTDKNPDSKPKEK